MFINLVECVRKLRWSSKFVTIKGVQFKGLKCILEDFLNGKFAGCLPLIAAVPSAFSLPAVEGVTLPQISKCLILVPAPISQLLLEGHFEVWSTFSVFLVEPTEASENTGAFAKAYRLWGSPQNRGCPCRESKLGVYDLAVLGSRVIWLGGESRVYHESFFTWVGLAACLAQVSGFISAVSKWFGLNNPRHYTLALL